MDASPSAAGYRFAVVVSRFNEDITDGLLFGAREALREASVRSDDVEIVHVPGAFEIPVAALHLAESGRFDAIICLGCLIKGDTMHFEYIASAATQGIMDGATSTGIPMAFGLLTTLTDAQAAERAAPGPGNKGREAALAAVEMASLLRTLAVATFDRDSTSATVASSGDATSQRQLVRPAGGPHPANTTVDGQEGA